MKFREIVARLTGLSTPVFGVSWGPLEPEIDVARRVIAYLEDRRVLYNPGELEVPEHCVESVLDIRRTLTRELAPLDRETELAASNTALGELRGFFGVHVARLAVQHGLDVEDDLAAILPAADEEPKRAPRE